MTVADPIDLAVKRAWDRKPEPKQSVGARMLEEAMSREAGTVSPLVERVASCIFSFDQEAIEQPWSRLGPLRRQTYYDIAEAVIAEVRR